jgi:hypothetical protein
VIGELTVAGLLVVRGLCALGTLLALPGVWVVFGEAAAFVVGAAVLGLTLGVGSAAGRSLLASAT